MFKIVLEKPKETDGVEDAFFMLEPYEGERLVVAVLMNHDTFDWTSLRE